MTLIYSCAALQNDFFFIFRGFGEIQSSNFDCVDCGMCEGDSSEVLRFWFGLCIWRFGSWKRIQTVVKIAKHFPLKPLIFAKVVGLFWIAAFWDEHVLNSCFSPWSWCQTYGCTSTLPHPNWVDMIGCAKLTPKRSTGWAFHIEISREHPETSNSSTHVQKSSFSTHQKRTVGKPETIKFQKLPWLFQRLNATKTWTICRVQLFIICRVISVSVWMACIFSFDTGSTCSLCLSTRRQSGIFMFLSRAPSEDVI